MKRQDVISVLLLGILAITGIRSQARAGTWVTIGPDSARGYLALPEGKGPHPALIVVHEYWGLAPWITGNADEFARKGYVALAVDLYGGKIATTPEEAMSMMRSVRPEAASRVLQGADSFLRDRSDVIKGKIGSIGWCMGGGYSLRTALLNPTLAACVICYGMLVTDPEQVSKIPCPLLCIYGGKDKVFPADTLRTFEKAARMAKKSVTSHIYPEADHAFMNPNNKAGYRKGDADDAWTRIYAFLDGKLKKPM